MKKLLLGFALIIGMLIPTKANAQATVRLSHTFGITGSVLQTNDEFSGNGWAYGAYVSHGYFGYAFAEEYKERSYSKYEQYYIGMNLKFSPKKYSQSELILTPQVVKVHQRITTINGDESVKDYYTSGLTLALRYNNILMVTSITEKSYTLGLGISFNSK